MLNGPSSCAAPLVIPRTAHLVAAYAKQGEPPRMLVQETHLAVEHIICELVERELYGYEDEQ